MKGLILRVIGVWVAFIVILGVFGAEIGIPELTIWTVLLALSNVALVVRYRRAKQRS
ncbi:hypothetical protein [Streptomyces hokutonensis]|uniref:hypothetical protein n=1 Tax=Streptomyces hokutonensis TaxID=1306990 RepID=UPI001319C2D2|nr:hypothetical protein [Streptomyces hokutonensis]